MSVFSRKKRRESSRLELRSKLDRFSLKLWILVHVCLPPGRQGGRGGWASTERKSGSPSWSSTGFLASNSLFLYFCCSCILVSRWGMSLWRATKELPRRKVISNKRNKVLWGELVQKIWENYLPSRSSSMSFSQDGLASQGNLIEILNSHNEC